MFDCKSIESKWQKAWADAKLFEVEPNDRKSMMITSAIPYVNSPPHMGHLRTYGLPDAYARYLRMRGFNVLYPFGFHATGTPLIGYAKRITNKDQDLIDSLHTFHVSDEDIGRMTDPKYIADYFIRQQEREIRREGVSVDWRRKFITTEPMFSKLIGWQFQRLKDKGYLVQGTHPVGWCPNENNAVGQHDTLHDVQPDIEGIVAIKFRDKGSDAYFVCATYRPETLYGVTNLFVNLDVNYVLATVDGVRCYMSKDAAFRLSYQFDVKVEGEISAQELLRKTAVNPITNEEVPVLPGYFVRDDKGSGVVMSVPAHAPFDYVALERLKASGYAMPEMHYEKLIELNLPKGKEGIGVTLKADEARGSAGSVIHPEIPALAYLELLKADPSSDGQLVELATKVVYREEARYGTMLVGAYKGKSEPEARDRIKEDLVNSRDAFIMYELANDEPVICRCKNKAVVAIVKNQWFINYGDKEWKARVREHLKTMRIYPEKLRHTFETLVEWIDLRATERAEGLGTPFPFNPSHMIESLSDSTIYMVYYTFDHILRANAVRPEQLLPQFFDYLINSQGELQSVAKSTGIPEPVITKCKESLDYWYANTSRHSAPDLIPNHYTMYIFNHVALLPEKFWPKQIVVNGFVNYEGEKMSKSLGNIIPMGDAVGKYGADPLRFIEIAGAELETETEFNTDALNGVTSRVDYLYSEMTGIDGMRSNELKGIDFWLYSRLNSKIGSASEAMDNLMLKAAYGEIFYNSVNELKKYHDLGGSNALVLSDYITAVVKMIAPIMPHVAEEFWHALGNTSLLATEQWPIADESMINRELESCYEVVDATAEDIGNAVQLTGKMDANKGKSLKSIRIIVAEPWKTDAYNMLVEGKQMGEIIGSGRFDKGKAAKYLQQFRNTRELTETLRFDSNALFSAFSESRDYLRKRFGCDISIEREAESSSARAPRAQPKKPSIEVTWG